MADDSPTPTWKQKYGKYILAAAVWLATWGLGFLAAYLGLPAPPPVVVDRVVTIPADNLDEFSEKNPRGAMGWNRDDDAVAEVSKSLIFPVFGLTPAGQVESIPDHIYLWESARSLLGRDVPTHDQGNIGSCVANGAAGAVEYCLIALMTEAKRTGRPIPIFKEISEEVIYGGSRVQIGKGRIRGDGSVGAWAAQWCKDYGVIARGVYGDYDLSQYSVSTCRTFGSRGCPQALIPEAKKHPTRQISKVTTVDEAKKALASGYPITIASDVGFGNIGPYTRNSKGQLSARGTWNHQMVLLGYDKGSGFLCMNSWGTKWVGGPKGPGDPPPGSFYIEDRTVQRILDQGDSWAYGDQVGFPARRPDWFIVAPKRNRLDSLVALDVEARLAW